MSPRLRTLSINFAEYPAGTIGPDSIKGWRQEKKFSDGVVAGAGLRGTAGEIMSEMKVCACATGGVDIHAFCGDTSSLETHPVCVSLPIAGDNTIIVSLVILVLWGASRNKGEHGLTALCAAVALAVIESRERVTAKVNDTETEVLFKTDLSRSFDWRMN
ncbi:hypothetical protein J6590_058238 [Homalodisca vitripennis]|nr:hypothetical protein J6590_058238 [Homalodisca vitripennis]